MRRAFVWKVWVLLALPCAGYGQPITSCFEVRSILVDACDGGGGVEGHNEMVYFLTGSNALNTANLNITWANATNSWAGVCQNATTAQKVAALNASIQACGYLIEPTGGILPPNKKVVLITGIAAFNPSANSFANLTDTLYVIFHCPNGAQVSSGNFGNGTASNPTNPRNFSMGFSGVSGCNSRIYSYRPIDLDGGDGATVLYASDGTPTHINNGCVAPYIPLSPAWTVPAPLCQGDASINLNSLVTGTSGGRWSGQGVSGNMFNPSGLSGPIPVTYTVGDSDCDTEEQETHPIIVNAGGNASWNSPGTICSSQSPLNLNTYVSGTSGGTWSGQGVSGSTFNPAGLNGNITVTYTVGSGTCAGSVSRVITVQSSGNASWQPPGTVCNTASPISLNPLVTGTPGGTWSGQGVSGTTFNPAGLNGDIAVIYTVGSGGCQDVSQQTISVQPSPPVLSGVTGRTVYCNEPVSALSVTPQQGATVSWYADAALTILRGTGAEFLPPVGQSTTYYVNQSIGTCVGPAIPVTVTFNPVPAPPVVTDTVRYCAGSPPPLLSAGGNGTLNWYADAGLTQFLHTGTTYQPVAGGETERFYVVALLGACGSSPSQVSLKQEQPVSVKISPEGPLVLCRASSIRLHSSAASGNQWSTGALSASITVTQPGWYKVLVSSFCNTASDSVLVNDRSAIAAFTVTPASGQAPLEVTISDGSINASQVSWYLNGVPFAFPPGGHMLFGEDGEYRIKQVVTNADGCTDSLSRLVRVITDFVQFLVPNTFTPNNDGINDTFKVVSTGLVELEGMIFNRWGEQIYRFTGVYNGWDGRMNGMIVPDGVYLYVINARDLMGRYLGKTGAIRLIR